MLNRGNLPPQVPPMQRGASRYLRPQELRRFKGFQFAARLVVEGFYAGRHRSPFHDASAEFADYRAYVPGDEIRALDWRAYARTDRDYVKLFRKESDMRCHVLLDSSRSMAFNGEPTTRNYSGSSAGKLRAFWEGRKERLTPKVIVDMEEETGSLSKFEYGAYLTAALCYLMIQQGDKASLALGGADIQTFVPPGGTITHLHSLLHTLERARPDGPTDIASAVRSLFALARRRGLLVVISDFLEDPSPLFGALSMFTHRGWKVVLLHVLTDMELELPGDGPSRYLDSEGPGAVNADPDSLRPAYQAEIEAWLEEVTTQAKARRIHYTRMTTTTTYDRALERYLTARAHS